MTNTPVDKEEAEAHSLAERAGFVWYDTEAAARMMARHAATEILALSSALTASEKDAEEYRWLKAHPDEFSSAVNDAYGQWGGDEAQEFADILGDEIKHQRSKV